MAIKLRRESALNLTLEGSVGSFRVGTGADNQTSSEVKYFLTHVGLDFAAGRNDALLAELAPVREIFDYQSLEFDEIMQRDIDDARVSAELIPYLLDDETRDLVKLFPPIIVIVLPVHEDRNRPAQYYPAVNEISQEETSDEPGQQILRAGEIGQEVFQFEQPVQNGYPLAHDLTRLRINTHKARLVIVDGQHRAMALLAIYRNLKDQWTDARRAPYREYYAEWTPNYISQFNLTDIQLPVMLCTIPSLDQTYSGDFDLRKAARSIFLTLNKTARKVSSSRNILLDDNDLISVFLRRCLAHVKAKDPRSPSSFRIWNVELDQFRDKLRIESPMALTGVSHLYYVIEHLMMDSGDVTGVSPRSGYFQVRTKLDNCLDRLNGRDVLGAEVAESVRRDNFSDDVAELLGKEFDNRYARFITATFERFFPYEAHNRAAVNLEKKIESFQDRQLRPILFEGQGIGRVFDAHRSNLREKLRGGHFRTDVPQIEAICNRLDGTAERIDAAIKRFRADRASLLLDGISDKRKIRDDERNQHPRIVKWIDDFFQNVLTTVAFEAAMICGFFDEVEKAARKASEDGNEKPDVAQVFDEYTTQLNAFFVPKTYSQLVRLVKVFTGEPIGESVAEWKIKPTNQTFRDIVYRGEMQPDQWPKYKYLFLELWNPTDHALKTVVQAERELCRTQVFFSLYKHNKKLYCRENLKLEDDLEKDELRGIFDRSLSAYNELLRNLNAYNMDKSFAQDAITVEHAGDDTDEPVATDVSEIMDRNVE